MRMCLYNQFKQKNMTFELVCDANQTLSPLIKPNQIIRVNRSHHYLQLGNYIGTIYRNLESNSLLWERFLDSCSVHYCPAAFGISWVFWDRFQRFSSCLEPYPAVRSPSGTGWTGSILILDLAQIKGRNRTKPNRADKNRASGSIGLVRATSTNGYKTARFSTLQYF